MTFEFARFRLQLCFSFFALFSLMLLSGSGTVALLCFFSSLLHESGHLFFLALFHVDVRLISFSAGGILIERRDGGSCGLSGECLIALGGVIVNCLLCGAFWFCYAATNNRNCGVLCVVNGALAAMNLLPVRTLDSYRVLELLLYHRSPEKAGSALRRVSFGAVCISIFVCLCLFCCGHGNPSLAAVCVYLMLMHWKTE
ncbi:MAG: hypothetical protein IKR49_08425 [Clostridia bacterium]|nr:hypothetical protein [Clostridia bacterium]